MKRRVVITGIGIITGLGVGKDVNWKNMIDGKSSVAEITSFDTSRYQGKKGSEIKLLELPSMKHLNPERIDRATILLIIAIKEALEEAGFGEDKRQQIPVLLSLGTTLGGMLSGETFHKAVLDKGLRRAPLSLIMDYLAHCQARKIFKEFGLIGDYLVISDACASGTNAIGNAYRRISHGEFDMAICGGYDTMSEFTFSGFNSLMAVTPTVCRPFDRDRDGLVLGEAAGIMVLEALDFAKQRGARILCEIAGYGCSSDAYHMTGPDTSGRYAAEAIYKAWHEAGLVEIDYINAHGTATRYNDLMEARAINIVFNEKAKKIPVSSIKPLIGHTLGAAGAIEAIVSVLSILYNQIPPNINLKNPDPECPINVVNQPQHKEVKTSMSNSFGFGGANASIVFREFAE